MKNVSTLVLGVVFVGSVSSCFGDTLAEGKSALENKMYDKAAALLENHARQVIRRGAIHWVRCMKKGMVWDKTNTKPLHCIPKRAEAERHWGVVIWL